MRIIGLERYRAAKNAGARAHGLHWLAHHGFRTPAGWVVPWSELDGLEPDAEAMLTAALTPLVGDGTLAVRASVEYEPALEADVEPALSFESVLGVSGPRDVARAVLRVRDQENQPKIQAALQRAEIDPEALRVGVVIQRLVEPVVSGTAFSMDPITHFSRTVVEAVNGSAEGVRAGSATPLRWVRRHGVWSVEPTSSDIPMFVVIEVADLVEQIGRKHGWPVEVTWVWDGEHVFFVDMSEVPCSDGASLYSHRAAHAAFPDVVTPLMWSVGAPLTVGAWTRLAREALGETDLDPSEVVRLIHHRAYVNIGALGRACDSAGLDRGVLEAIALGGGARGALSGSRFGWRAVLRAPRIARFAARTSLSTKNVEREASRIQRDLERFKAGPDCADLTAKQVLTRVDDLLPIVSDARYLEVVAPLVVGMHASTLRRRLTAVELDIDDIAFPSDGGESADSALDGLHASWDALPPGTRAAVSGGRVSRVRATKSGRTFLTEVDAFLAQYGHGSDWYADISVARWSEDLRSLLRAIARRVPCASATPPVTRDRLVEMGAAASVLRSYDRVAAWRELAHRVSELNALAYAELRPLYLRLADILQRRGWLDRPADVFMLTAKELGDALAFNATEALVRETVVRRTAELNAAGEGAAPDLIFGEKPAPLAPVHGEQLRAAPESGGYGCGAVVRVENVDEIGRVMPGSIAILPDASARWAPVLVRAGAVIAGRGGFRSPLAEAARDRGVALVVVPDSEGLALPDAWAFVDGYTGSVVLTDSAAEEGLACDVPAADEPETGEHPDAHGAVAAS
ncbi:MAG: hypothetical protein HY876_03680 [Coriobacteriales bacterium]|nr:hypothetical protein [Coriobacteriales bacterium]